jgi:serine phosphatase RsbU (regulator of sigma subunit)
VLGALLYGIFAFFITDGFSTLAALLVSALIFFVWLLFLENLQSRVENTFYRRIRQRKSNTLMSDFIERVSTCFTFQEFASALRDELELKMDATVLLIRSSTWEIIYSSSSTLGVLESTKISFRKNFFELSEGFGFLDDSFNLSSSKKDSRGFFIYCKGYYIFCITRTAERIDSDMYRILYAELLLFFDRVLTVSRLFEIAALSKEWHLIAETQRSFLPQSLPKHPLMKMATYFRPLINVSGDFYDAITIDANRVLLVLGDVSGKGLGAALVMGIVINAIRTAVDKTDLAGIIRKCDSAIHEMGFDDKYTVLFIGLLDLSVKKLFYINAAMPDQFQVVQTIKGPVVKRLESNNSLIGLVPLESIPVSETEIRSNDVIILTTDGLTELENEEGKPFDQDSDTLKLLHKSIDMDIEDTVDQLATLGEIFVGSKPLRDDITIVGIRMERLWD